MKKETLKKMAHKKMDTIYRKITNRDWWGENLRIVISIIIIVTIAGGIFSYSKRCAENPNGSCAREEK